MTERINRELVLFGRAFLAGSRIGAVAGVITYACYRVLKAVR